MNEVRIHFNSSVRVVCAHCKTDLKRPIASICEVCNESLGVTGIISLEAGGGGGGFAEPHKPAITVVSSAAGASGGPGHGRPTLIINGVNHHMHFDSNGKMAALTVVSKDSF